MRSTPPHARESDVSNRSSAACNWFGAAIPRYSRGGARRALGRASSVIQAFSESSKPSRSTDSNERSISNGYYGEIRRPAYVPARHQCSPCAAATGRDDAGLRSEEHTSEPQSQFHLVCRLLLEKKK